MSNKAQNIATAVSINDSSRFFIAVIQLVNIKKFETFNDLNKEPSFIATEYLHSSSLGMRPSFYRNFTNFLLYVIESYRPKPQI